MALELMQQLDSLLVKSKNALVILPHNPAADAIAAGSALYFFLASRGLTPTLAFVDDFNESARLNFLPRPEQIQDHLRGSQELVLLFNTQYNNILAARTERSEKEFRIYVTPEKGGIDPRDFSFMPSRFKYDLLIVLDSPDKESLGSLFEDSPDIFYEVPIVNIDRHAGNENFGQINWVNMTAVSTAEILAELMEKIGPQMIDERIANYLLAGIILATESFQKRTTTPKSLQLASRLMERGADQQLISRYLYKTQPLNLLKLWGRLMVRLNWEEDIKLVWSEVTAEDFVQSRASSTDLPFVLEKLADNYSAGKIFAAFYQDRPGMVHGILSAPQPELLQQLSASLGGRIQRNLLFLEIANDSVGAGIASVLQTVRQQVQQ